MAFCPSCGNPTGADDKFCAKCGKTILSTESPLESPGTQPGVIGDEDGLTNGYSPSPAKNGGLPVPPVFLYAALVLLLILGGVTAVLWQGANSRVNDLTTERDTLVEERDDLNSQVQNLSGQITTLSGQISSLEAAKSLVETQLSSIQSKYPLKNFSTYGELQNWLFNAIAKLNPLDDYPKQYYMLQRLAMEDGYYLSVAIWEDEEFYYPELYAVVGDTVYICFEDGSIYVSFYLS